MIKIPTKKSTLPYQIVTCLFLFFLASCSSEEEVLKEEQATGEYKLEENKTWNVNREGQHALDIVFFIPSDYTANDSLLNKVSDVMLYIQKWYAVQMKMQGFGEKTFGLITDESGKVRVHLVEGEQEGSFYSGHQEMKKEIDAYFSSNPGFREGEHLLVLEHRRDGAPFKGTGKTAYANSSDFTLTATGKAIDGFELKTCPLLGGIIHELGHCLNLPHSCHKGSDSPKISLMSFGNFTYQKDPEKVFLTKSSCAILNVCQVFNKKSNGVTYYSIADNADLKEYSIVKDSIKKALIADGIFTSNIKPTHFYIGHDGFPAGGKNNYDDISFTVTPKPTSNPHEYAFHLEMPYSDLFNNYKDKGKDDMQLTFNLIIENGLIKRLFNYNYTIDLSTKIPNDDVNKLWAEFEHSNRSNWTITANTTSPNQDRIITTTLDGNNTTYWHSDYPYDISSQGPHEITIDMAESKTINGVYLYSDRSGSNYSPKHIIVQTSSDGGITYNTVKEYSISTITSEIKVNFDTPKTTRYLKILVNEVFISKESEENLILNEIDIIR